MNARSLWPRLCAHLPSARRGFESARNITGTPQRLMVILQTTMGNPAMITKTVETTITMVMTMMTTMKKKRKKRKMRTQLTRLRCDT